MHTNVRTPYPHAEPGARCRLIVCVFAIAVIVAGCSSSDSDTVEATGPVNDASEPVTGETTAGEAMNLVSDTSEPVASEATEGTAMGLANDTSEPVTDEAIEGEATSPAGMETPQVGSETAQTASFRLVFDGTWSPETHPSGFPDGPHFSGLVGAVHNEQVRFWEPGQIATDGVKQVAELGAKPVMNEEVAAAIDAGSALAPIDGPGIADAPGVSEVEFEVTLDYPQISVITMLAPSPDWFTGVHGQTLLDETGGWIDSMTIELLLYDAGTDSGTVYEAANLPTEPRSPIERVTSEPSDTPFVDGGPVVGSYRIERVR